MDTEKDYHKEKEKEMLGLKKTKKMEYDRDEWAN